MRIDSQVSEVPRDLRLLRNVRRNELMGKKKDEVVEITCFLSRLLTRYIDKTYGPRETASMFNRRKSWIYDAMSRPRTQLQRKLAKIAVREDGGLLFRLSDLIRIRDEMFEETENA